MNDETLKQLREVENQSVDDVKQLDAILDVDDKMAKLNFTEKATKLEHAERELRLRESQHKLEAEKFKYQQEQNKKDNTVKLVVAGLAGGGALLGGAAKLLQVIFQRQYVKEAYNIEQVTTIASPTARMLLKDGTSPRL